MPEAAHASVRAEALALRRLGWSCIDVGLELGVSPQAVGRWSKRAGITTRAYTPPMLPLVDTTPTVHYSAALGDCWPMPVAFPPVVPGTARTIRGVLHVEVDGSGERHHA